MTRKSDHIYQRIVTIMKNTPNDLPWEKLSERITVLKTLQHEFYRLILFSKEERTHD